MVEVLPRVVEMEGDTVLTQYMITKWTLEYKDKGISAPYYEKYLTELISRKSSEGAECSDYPEEED